jgi:hypothetical protein
MSGCSTATYCPNCGNTGAVLYEDYKPFPHSLLNCDECGFYTTVKSGYLTLKQLNEDRAMNLLPPIKNLPKRNKDIVWK